MAVSYTHLEEAFDGLLRLMAAEDREKAEAAYSLEDGLYVRKELTGEEREELNAPFGKAMVAEAGLAEQGVDVLQLSQAQLQAMLPGVLEQVEAISDSIVTQAAVA